MHVEWEAKWRNIDVETPKVGEWVQVKYCRCDGQGRAHGPELGPVVAMACEHPHLPRPALFFDCPELDFPNTEPHKVVCWRRPVKRDTQYEERTQRVDLDRLLDVPAEEVELA